MRFTLNGFVVTASELHINITQLERETAEVSTDTKNQLEHFLFCSLEDILAVLCSSFCVRPTITEQHGRTGITRGRTTVTVWHTADGEHCVIVIVLEGLRLCLIQLCGDYTNISGLSVHGLHLDCAEL